MPNDHHDEHGRFAAGQSKVARTMSGKAERTFPGYGTQHTYKSKSGKHLSYSMANVFAGERAKGMQKRSEKRAKLKTIARGKRDVGRSAYTKGLTETTKRFKAKGLKGAF